MACFDSGHLAKFRCSHPLCLCCPRDWQTLFSRGRGKNQGVQISHLYFDCRLLCIRESPLVPVLMNVVNDALANIDLAISARYCYALTSCNV